MDVVWSQAPQPESETRASAAGQPGLSDVRVLQPSSASVVVRPSTPCAPCWLSACLRRYLAAPWPPAEAPQLSDQIPDLFASAAELLEESSAPQPWPPSAAAR